MGTTTTTTQPVSNKHLKVLTDSIAVYRQRSGATASSTPTTTEPTLDALLGDIGSLAVHGLEMSAPTDIDYLSLRKNISYSELAAWMECNWRHKLKYLDDIKMEADGPSEHTEYGQAMHDALEEFLKTRKFPLYSAIAAAMNTMFDALPEQRKPTFKRSDFIDTIEPVLSEVPKFMDETFGPEWEYVAAEFPLMEAIDNHNHQFKGYIDGIIRARGGKHKNKWVYYIIDWKCSGYFWPMAKRTDPKKTMQLIFYKYFYARKLGIDPDDIKCGFVILRRSKKPGNCLFVPVSAGPAATKRALETIDTMLSYIQKKMFPKNRESCKYCVYKGTDHCP